MRKITTFFLNMQENKVLSSNKQLNSKVFENKNKLKEPPKVLIFSTKSPQRWEFSTPIIYRGKKIAAEVAASVKNFLISIYRTLQAIKHKVAATLSTIAATFCIIIIEAQMLKHKSHRKPIEVPQISYSGRLTCSIFIPNTSKEFLYKSHQQITISQTITCISANFSVPLQHKFS